MRRIALLPRRRFLATLAFAALPMPRARAAACLAPATNILGPACRTGVITADKRRLRWHVETSDPTGEPLDGEFLPRAKGAFSSPNTISRSVSCATNAA